MKYASFLKIAAALVLLTLSLFNYSRETRRQSESGNSVMRIQFDGAAIATIILGFVAISSARAFTKNIKQLSIRFGLPVALPKVSYEALPLLFLPFLIFGTNSTQVIPSDGGATTIVSGWGNSSFKLPLFVMLVVLVYLAKLRKRLLEIDGLSVRDQGQF
jgi:hypothetical protein